MLVGQLEWKRGKEGEGVEKGKKKAARRGKSRCNSCAPQWGARDFWPFILGGRRKMKSRRVPCRWDSPDLPLLSAGSPRPLARASLNSLGGFLAGVTIPKSDFCWLTGGTLDDAVLLLTDCLDTRT